MRSDPKWDVPPAHFTGVELFRFDAARPAAGRPPSKREPREFAWWNYPVSPSSNRLIPSKSSASALSWISLSGGLNAGSSANCPSVSLIIS
jgi:hypothetical protein